ncbi:TIGR02996 domain-containing protein [Myxococcus landrumensis]|uniref:TIGR02996 domain-containing protein n=1 Tax=Myxococcus landrumensis TaxID=2813577 RepID=A0ABX7N063_9BACT|nr:TIGR02996 domain-containing protein [Myxococcus landrumus]QSQ11814.1 TIGR02996 domain-containing protein [Myxococcus landrumus]
MGDILEMHLERAEDALARSDGEGALGHLLEAWKECRAEPLIALIQRLSDHLVAGLTPLDESMTLYWKAQGRHAMDLPRVLKDLLAAVLRHRAPLPGGTLDWLRRLFPADPRMVPVVLASARLLKGEQQEALRMHNAVLIYLEPPYDVEPLRELRARLPRNLGKEAERLDTVIRRGESWVPPVLSASDQERCAALLEAVEARISGTTRSATTRDALFARIHASPKDDEARRVLADVLLEQGDPLGEFITLQFASEPDEARMESLLEMNRTRWVVPLGPYVDPRGTRFERGFPVSVLMKTSDIPEPPAAWGTVEEVRWPYASARSRGHLLNSPALRHVTSLRGASGTLVCDLKAPEASALQRLSLMTTEGKGLVTALAALPQLRWLEVDSGEPGFVAQCLESPLASRLECFEVRGGVMHIHPRVLGPSHSKWSLELRRDAEVPVTLVLDDVRDVEALVPVLRAATRFSSQALRVRLCFEWGRGQTPGSGAEISTLFARGRALLEEAASAYTRVIWEED